MTVSVLVNTRNTL